MSTNDVPGFNPSNNDKLAMGCWAEHKDGSLIHVDQIGENDTVIFSVFDLAMDVPVEYRHALRIGDFGRKFSVDPDKLSKKVGTDVWTWHDKTPFPWERVMQKGVREGLRHPSLHQIEEVATRARESAAKRVKDDLDMKSYPLRDTSHLSDSVRQLATSVLQGIADALRGMKQ